MPLYDYKCDNCDNEFEALQSAGEEPLKDCSNCGEPRLKKVPSAPSFNFKGGGWYKDLYSSGGGSGNSGDSGSGDSSKTDTKSSTSSSDTSSKSSSPSSTKKSKSSDAS